MRGRTLNDSFVILDEAQFAPRNDRVGRIKHLRNSLGCHLLLNGLEIVAVVEDLHVEVMGSACGIEPQAIHRSSTVSGDQHVVRNADEHLPIHPHRVITALAVGGVLDAAVQGHETSLIGMLDLPRAGLREPVLGLLALVSVIDFLLEQTIFVIDAVTTGRHS